jgi:hypothetical protein
VFEDVFHAAVNKAQMIAGKTKKFFKNPLRIIDVLIISLSLKTYDLQGSTFVTRMKSNGAYKRIKNNPHEKNGVIISDVLI